MMEEVSMCQGQQVREQHEGLTSLATKSDLVRRHLSDSIYLWACGEKTDDEDHEPKLSDRLIGWLILFMQGFAYTMLIVLARPDPSSDVSSFTDDSGESSFLLPSVTGAMYLLVASTTHDLRAGFSLLVDGSCAGNRAFGAGLLIVYGIMVTAAMTVLVSTSDDSASVVLNAVAVLFVADLDEKALKFLSTVPQKWRLFWAIQSIGASFTMALIAISYIGASSPLLQGSNRVLAAFPSWFVWAINPAAVTLSSYMLSSALSSVCEKWCEGWTSAVEPSFGVRVKRALQRVFAEMNILKERFIGEPCFYVMLSVWIAQSVRNWFRFKTSGEGFSGAFDFVPMNPSTDGTKLAITSDKFGLLYSNAVLVAGLTAKVLVVFCKRREGVSHFLETTRSSDRNAPTAVCRSWVDSRVPSLLVGWGLGYWVLTLVLVLACSWHGGGCGWNDAPVVVTCIGYVVIPCFMLAGMFMVADLDFLGTRFGAFVKPAVDILTNRRGVEYWAMASLLRDVLMAWVAYCDDARMYLG